MTLQKLYSEMRNLKEVDDDFCIPRNIMLLIDKNFQNYSQDCVLCPLDRLCHFPSYEEAILQQDIFYKEKLLKFLVKNFPFLLLEDDRNEN